MNLLRKEANPKWEWTRDVELAFRKLKRLFGETPILQHFDPTKPIILQTDASGFAIAGVLNQYDRFGVLRPTLFYSRKCTPAEQNYDTYDWELLVIVESFKQWRHYLKGARHQILVRCDDKNLEYFTMTKMLSRRQARWSEILSSYDFRIEHLEGSKNPADGPSQRPDYEIGYERPIGRLLATYIKDSHDDLVMAIREAQKHDKLAQDTIEQLTAASAYDTGRGRQGVRDGSWRMGAGMLTMEGRVYVPDSDSLRIKVLERSHENPESGHFGATRTLELASRDFFWHGMDQSVRKYVTGCQVCHRVKAPRHARYGTNMPIELLSRPW